MIWYIEYSEELFCKDQINKIMLNRVSDAVSRRFKAERAFLLHRYSYFAEINDKLFFLSSIPTRYTFEDLFILNLKTFAVSTLIYPPSVTISFL